MRQVQDGIQKIILYWHRLPTFDIGKVCMPALQLMPDLLRCSVKLLQDPDSWTTRALAALARRSVCFFKNPLILSADSGLPQKRRK